MKKVIAFVLCFVLTLSVCASTSETFMYEYENEGITIVFDEETPFSKEERQSIADYLAHGEDDSVSTQSLCWLTGHKLTSDSVIEIRHKVSTKAPRCYRTIYEVITCSKCDYVETNKLASSFIDCCAVD